MIFLRILTIRFLNLNNILIQKWIYLTLVVFMLASFARLFHLIFRVENLFSTFCLILLGSLIYFILNIKGLYKISNIFLFSFIISIILGPEIINSILERGELGWYDEIDGQIGFALTAGSFRNGFNHFWAGGTPYNHGFDVGNLPLYFAKNLNISIYYKILLIKILYWFLALVIPLKLIYRIKNYDKNIRFNRINHLLNIFLFILAILNILEFHGWIFARGFLAPLVVVYITFIRSYEKKNNFYIFLVSVLIYLFGTFLIPSFLNGGLEALFAIALINLVDILQFKELPKSIIYKTATTSLILIISYIVINQISILREINLEEFSRSIRMNYPSFNNILIDLISNPSLTAVLGSICILGLNNKLLRFRSFLYIMIPLCLIILLSFVFSNFEFDYDIYNKFKVLRTNIFLSSLNFLLLDLILIKIKNNSIFKKYKSE